MKIRKLQQAPGEIIEMGIISGAQVRFLAYATSCGRWRVMRQRDVFSDQASIASWALFILHRRTLYEYRNANGVKFL